ncbi:MAG TPA: type II secretion system protein GspJ [Candidatus Sumerlaeota bacterium]|nr:type II secretion system protein GspJ [Candidatus Sumerlaeota bacterium]HPS00248.1 type II secretion system protein GspJ [Candidatus Sumerlaeota bacterium]
MTRVRHSVWCFSVRPRGRAQGGFTLLEILAGSAMLAVLVVGLVSAFYSAIKMREKTNAALDKDQPLQTCLQVMKRDFTSAMPSNGLLSGTFVGEKGGNGDSEYDQVEFNTATGLVNKSAPWGDLCKVSYTLKNADDILKDDSSFAASETNDADLTGPSESEWIQEEASKGLFLVRTLTRNLLPTTSEDSKSEVLLSGIDTLEFSYYDGEEWAESWDSSSNENAVPKAIKALIVFRADRDSSEPVHPDVELVVAMGLQPVPTSTSSSSSSSGGGSATPTPESGGGGGGGTPGGPSGGGSGGGGGGQ